MLANGTARCLLEMLFGVGMVILTDRAATRMGGWHVLRAYAFRNLVLFGFGVVHVLVLLWPGDILHTYGIAALIAVLFRRAKPRLMFAVGLSLAVAQLVLAPIIVHTVRSRQEAGAALAVRAHDGLPMVAAERKQLADWRERQAERTKADTEQRTAIAQENRARTGTALTWAQAAWHSIANFEKNLAELFAIWESAATMLIGAALYRWGVIQGSRSRRFYAVAVVLGYAFGFAARAALGTAVLRFDHQPTYAFMFNEFSRLATTLAHLSLVNLLLTTALGARLLRPFIAAGRTALSIYIAQTLVCLWVLYPPWGLQLYGRGGWAVLMETAVAVDSALLLGANLWVRHFAIAPVEWAWRSILAGRRLPFGRGKRSAKGPLATA